MKKKLGLLIGLLMLVLVGCQGKPPEEETFHLTTEEKQAYTEQINQVIEEFYWDYDKDSLIFSRVSLPENIEENNSAFVASKAVGYDFSKQSGQDGVLATATLLHYNGDVAGMVEVLFQNDILVGVYYRGGYDQAVYSLVERNPYLSDGEFIQYEQWSPMTPRETSLNSKMVVDGFVAEGKDNQGRGVLASIQNGEVELYRIMNNVLNPYHTLSFSSGLEAISATFIQIDGEEQLAVLLVSDGGDGQGTSTEQTQQIAKIVFYGQGFTQKGELLLEGNRYTCIDAHDEKLLLFTDKNMEIYGLDAEGWKKEKRELLKNTVNQCHVVDLDGDGKKEYLLTDGLDLYMYQYETTGLEKIWSTHLGVESLYGSLYSGDLNGDGVKEVYICDATGTTIRYILTPKGLISSNGDIVYGQAIYPCDLNGDGIDDYLNIMNEDSTMNHLFLSKE